jgi:uroporphyrin-III C-methyltransferase
MAGNYKASMMTDDITQLYEVTFREHDHGARGCVSLVGAGPGDMDLITVRGERALALADVILYDSLVDQGLLRNRSAALIYVGKRCGRHSMSQEEITALLIRCARSGKNIVRLKGGDPSIFGRVGEEALALAAAEIPFEIIPGVSSAIAAPAMAGIPVTHRGVSDGVVTVTAHKRLGFEEPGIPPYREETTLVLLMALSTIEKWQPQLLRQGYPRDVPLAFIVHGCTPDEHVVESCVGDALTDSLDERVRSPCLVVIGQVVTLRSKLRPWLINRTLSEPRDPEEKSQFA